MFLVECSECHGKGVVECSNCYGSGTCECISCDAEHDCGWCDGEGEYSCEECKGAGKVLSASPSDDAVEALCECGRVATVLVRKDALCSLCEAIWAAGGTPMKNQTESLFSS